jgi:hypothetical protein
MHCAAATSPLILDTQDHLRCNQIREPNTAHHFRMPAKRVIPQSSDSDAPIVVTPRKNTSSLSALLNQDVLMSRASSKLAGRTDSPATPSHRSKVASPSAAPPKLVKVAAAAARRRASKPRMTALSSAGTNPGPVPEISSSTFYPAKEAEWTKRCEAAAQQRSSAKHNVQISGWQESLALRQLVWTLQTLIYKNRKHRLISSLQPVQWPLTPLQLPFSRQTRAQAF